MAPQWRGDGAAMARTESPECMPSTTMWSSFRPGARKMAHNGATMAPMSIALLLLLLLALLLLLLLTPLRYYYNGMGSGN